MGPQILRHGSLREIIGQIASLTEEDFICAGGKPNWTVDSPAHVIRIPKFTDLGIIGPIPEYFLEVFVARQVIADWSALRRGRQPSTDEMCEALIYYARHDAHIPLDMRP